MFRQARNEGERAVTLVVVLSVFLEILCSCARVSSPPAEEGRARNPSELVQVARDLPAVGFGGQVFHRRRLGNGLHAVAVRDDGEGVSVFVVIAAGKRQETPRTTGLAHLTEHAMYTGTEKIGPGEHDRRIQELGGKSNAFTREDYTLFYDHEIPADALGEVLEMEADRLRNLSFDPRAVYEERERLREEETKTWQPSRHLSERLEAAVFRRHPYAAGVMDGEGNTLASVLGIWDIREFYDRNYHPGSVAATFGVYEVLGHTDVLVNYRSAVERLALEEVLRVARTYLDPQRRVEVHLHELLEEARALEAGEPPPG